ncbi:hypothetical protein [Streptomyces aureus]|uniref:hypothetical protein n=1 Tax=Streptomyces aureus TaxID=193461 RepID=UPI0031E155A6
MEKVPGLCPARTRCANRAGTLLQTLAGSAQSGTPQASTARLQGRSGWILARHLVAVVLVLGLTLTLPLASCDVDVGMRILVVPDMGLVFVGLARC